jgi:8-oxo-dGTP pyrophosphatase MutT (NUDIX family)
VLLLHRVKTSTSFASAHVFPGGNVSASHDGVVPDEDSPERHIDSNVYRMAAIRETFEESGILLAKNKSNGQLLNVPEKDREEGRKLIHAGKVSFPDWLDQRGGVADTGLYHHDFHKIYD